MELPQTIAILLVEDDSDDYRLVAKQLREQHRAFKIDWADSLVAALDKLDRSTYDIILTDLSLPDCMGFETPARLRSRAPGTPIIVLTSLDDDCMEQDLLESGAQDYLVKGELSGRATLRAIQHAIQRQRMQNELSSLLTEREEHRLLMQQQAKLLKRKNRHLQRLYKTGQEFVDNVSHDFRTPLTVIKDYVSIIREGMVGEVNEQQQSMLDKVSVRADDLNNMVDDLLDASKLESGLSGAWRRSVPIYSIVDRAQSLLEQRGQVRNVEVVVDCEPGLENVYCDADMVGRVITNLAVNAIKFSDEGGKVRLWVQGEPHKHQIIVGVTDSGPGIDSESLSLIFERFNQADNQLKATVKGFGLGLNIANQFCRINLGELKVKSQIGKGSTFYFTLPIADPPEVFSRWMKSQCSPDDSLQLVHITLEKAENESLTSEFDSFLNCFLRKCDVLFRTSNDQWLLVLAGPENEADRWSHRIRDEFQKHNRNRPMGPLPAFQAETLTKWDTRLERSEVLENFRESYSRLNETAIATS